MVIGMILMTHGMKECDREEREEMVKNFQNCSGEFKKVYHEHDVENKDDLEKIICQLVDGLIGTCGELWNLCHSREIVMKIKEKQVKEMVKNNVDQEVDIEKCKEVVKLRYVKLLFKDSVLTLLDHSQIVSIFVST